MSDPTPQAPAEKSARQMTFAILEDGTVRADFGEGIEPISFHPATLPESLFPQALAGGFINRLRSYTSRLNGDGRTPAALHDAVAEGLSDLQKGIWAREREAGLGEISMEAEAAYRFRVKRAESRGETYDGTLESAVADFRALSDDQKAKLKALPRYQLALAEVKAERQAKAAEKLAKKVTADEEDVSF